ncbi:putative ribonuclease H-like domain-containing protein [Tanacetum coccineum]|uniref:Ribonuclease H-like domain-containing protein n=1 Tax=Tanacetum coccineum TaxID=301880 RepID=A0ABQ4ZLQ1_9ASTR
MTTLCCCLSKGKATPRPPVKAKSGKDQLGFFDLDYLTDSMNYQPVRSENQANKHAGQQEANHNAGTEDTIDVGNSKTEDESTQDCFVLPIWSSYSLTINPDLKRDGKREGPKEEEQVFLDELKRLKRQEKDANKAAKALKKEFAQETKNLIIQEGAAKTSNDSEIPPLEDIYQNSTDGIFTHSSYDDEGAVADFTNLETFVNVSPIPTSRIISSHPSALILRDLNSAVQTRSKVNKSSRAHAFVSYVQKQRRNNHKDFQHCLFACFLSQNEPKKISEALEDESTVDAMQEELLHFKIQKVWILVDLPFGKKAIGTKWVYRNKKDKRGVVVRNKARLVAQEHRQEEGIDYDENGYRRGTIDKTLFIKKDKHDIILVQVYVDDIIFGSTKKSWCDEFEALMKSRFQMSSMGELTFFLGLQVKQKADGIFISQDKYVAEILKKFDFANVKTASTPIETQKPLVKDEEASDVDVHLYRSMIGSLMYLTASRPDIMFAVCACSRFQVTPKSSHLSVVKRIFRYLKGKPKLGLWYPRVSSFDLESYSDSDYAGEILTGNPTTGGCQFLRQETQFLAIAKSRDHLWLLYTEAEYVAVQTVVGKFCGFKIKWFPVLGCFFGMINSISLHWFKGRQYDGLIGFRESLRRVIDGTEALLLPTLFILWLDTDSTDSAKLVPLGKFWTSAKSKIFNNVRHIIAKVAGKLVSISEASIRSDLLFVMGIHFSGKVTPLILFPSWYIPTEDEGAPSERPSEAQPTPFPAHTSEVPLEPQTESSPAPTSEVPIKPQTDPSPRPSTSTIIPDSIPESSGGNLGDQKSEASKTLINIPQRMMQSVSLKQRLARRDPQCKTMACHKESVSKLGRKFAKGEPSVQRDPLFDEIPKDTLDHMETENALDVGRTRDTVGEEKENDENILSTEDVLSTDKENTDKQIKGTDEQIEGTGEKRKGTDDHTKEGTKAVSREKEKGVELKDIEETDRPRPTSTRSLLTLKPLPKIDPKDKGKKKIEEEDESESESDGIPEVEKKFKQLAL